MRKLLTVSLLFLIALPARGDDQAEAYQTAVESAVWIVAFNRKWDATYGSGVLIGEEGLIATAYHVIGPDRLVLAAFPQRDADGNIISDSSQYFRPGILLQCVVVTADANKDLAIVRLKTPQAGHRVMPMAGHSSRPGEAVFTIGNTSHPGTLWRFAAGNVRQVYADAYTFDTSQSISAYVAEITVPINGGNSGGPLVNAAGELVGINSCVVRGQNQIQKAIDIRELKPLVVQARQFQAVEAAAYDAVRELVAKRKTQQP